jgi:hypothetical protein
VLTSDLHLVYLVILTSNGKDPDYIHIYIHAILEVANEIIQTAINIHRYIECTLLNSTKPFEDVVKSA